MSDPEVHVYVKTGKQSAYALLGKTEMVLNNLNPDFVKTFTLDYFFEKEQWIKFEVYDVDTNELEHIGNCETTIAKIMSSKGQSFLSDLTLPNKTASRGKIIVRADSVAQSNHEISFSMKANITRRMGGCLCGADNPYLLISRARAGETLANEYIRVYSTKHQAGMSLPNFGSILFKTQQLCNSDMNLNIKFELCNYRTSGNHPSYGHVIITAA